MTVFYAPEPLDFDEVLSKPTIFLAGSIDQNTASMWQDAAIQKIDTEKFNVLNPRRREWNPADNDNVLEMKKQIDWELDGIDNAHAVLMRFEPNSQSPISLLELGLILGKNIPVVISCPKDFWRRNNVIITAARYGKYTFHTLYHAIDEVQSLALKNFA